MYIAMTLLYWTQSSILGFLNALVQTSSGPNEKVYHQQEILKAGFDPELVKQVS